MPQWGPAVAPLLIFLAQTPLDAVIAVLLPLIYATGQAGQGLRLSLLWTALTWLLSLGMLVAWRDPCAIPVAFGLATLCATVLVIHSLPKALRVSWRPVLGIPLILAAILGAALQVTWGVIR